MWTYHWSNKRHISAVLFPWSDHDFGTRKILILVCREITENAKRFHYFNMFEHTSMVRDFKLFWVQSWRSIPVWYTILSFFRSYSSYILIKRRTEHSNCSLATPPCSTGQPSLNRRYWIGTSYLWIVHKEEMKQLVQWCGIWTSWSKALALANFIPLITWSCPPES